MKQGILFLLTLFFMYSTVKSQTAFQIGDGTTTSYYAPVYMATTTSTTKFSNHVSLFTAAEMSAVGMEAGVINSLNFRRKGSNCGYTGGNGVMRIYLAHTTATSYTETNNSTGANRFSVLAAGGTLVYSSTSQNVPTATQ